MKLYLISILCVIPILLQAEIKTAESAGFKYEYVVNDPLKARIYTLDNGLKVYLTVYKDEPRIQTFIPVRSGSKTDPADNTGLAHYLEHMMFKGTHEIATQDWEKESLLLKMISDLYEEHRNTKDEAKRKSIYHKIDSVSGEASKYSIANEYDKMVSSLGAKGTNAYTWVEQTVYTNEIPSNELEKWLKLESERFSELVLRLFHTELEAVYEEFNRTQDSDFRKVLFEIMGELFKKHPYGTQTTIGTGEHLKNPSMVKIHEYFDKNYVANNMAICLSGDFDFDATIKLVNKYWGGMRTGEIAPLKFEKEDPIVGPIVRERFGSEEEMMAMAWRLDTGAGSKDAMLLELADMILLNGTAGLMDLNLNQTQKVLNISTNPQIYEDYGMWFVTGSARDGQTMEEVKDLVLQEVNKLKAGEWQDWLIQGAVNDLKLRRIESYEGNRARSSALVESFILGVPWDVNVSWYDKMEKITKAEIIDFANRFFKKDNYVVVYKRTGEDTTIHKVEKPQISEVELNRGKQSKFMEEFLAMEAATLTPSFVDYEKSIAKTKLKNGIELSIIKNTLNKTFTLNYILEMGRNHDKKMALAVNYLEYLGTDKYTASQLKEEFYKLGISFSVNAGNDRLYVSMSGLDKSFEEGIKLFEHILANVKPDKEAYESMVAGILRNREDAKLNKGQILQGAMVNYARYGTHSAFTNILSEKELLSIDPAELAEKIKLINNFEHKIFYYGTRDASNVTAMLGKYHKVTDARMPFPAEEKFVEQQMIKPKVYFVEYDMVQAEVVMVSKGGLYNAGLEPAISLYNQYFGSGLSSIVFQEIRESRALAYSAFARYISPSFADKSYLMFSYVGTQADKMPDAIKGMSDIMANMPESEDQFEAARVAILKQIESDRITRDAIYWSSLAAARRGLNYDQRRDVYEYAKNAKLSDLVEFQQKFVKPNTYSYLVIGRKDKIDMEYLKTLGEFKELTLKEIFNY